MTARLLNLGCGATAHPAWVNVDHQPLLPGVLQADLRRRLSFGDESFDAAYASHVLEHLAPADGAHLLREMRRVLRPGGVARLVVPDLERSARGYLDALERADDARHEWSVIELIDQLVRDRSGGEMAAFIGRAGPDLRAHIASRVGEEALPGRWPRPALRARLRAALSALRGSGAAFRASGEAHRWMYDRRSLGRALVAAGFAQPRVVGFDESAIPGFAGFGLDGRDGRPRKPDSLFMEALRP